MSSEVTRTRQRIDQERESALRGLLGPAVVARHVFIESRLTQRANRILELIESHRVSDAMLLMEHESWGDDGTPPVVTIPEDEPEEEDARLDDAARTVHIARHRFVLLSQVLMRHPLLRHRQVRDMVPLHDGPDADGYELDALLFRFVPADDALAAHVDDALAAHFDEAVQILPPRWRALAQVRLATWRTMPIAISLACSWDVNVDFQHRFVAIHEQLKRHPLAGPCLPMQEIVWSEPLSLAVFERAVTPCPGGERKGL